MYSPRMQQADFSLDKDKNEIQGARHMPLRETPLPGDGYISYNVLGYVGANPTTQSVTMQAETKRYVYSFSITPNVFC
jgi:hypothetical protein